MNRSGKKKAVAWGVGGGLLAVAIVTELGKPAAERTGYGRVLGLVPYDFRFPTPTRMLEEVWRPSDPRVLAPTRFGVGWSINVSAVLRGLSRLRA